MPVFGEKELATQTDIAKHQDSCYKNHIKPIMDELKKFSQDFNDFRVEVATSLAEMPEKVLEKANEKFASKPTEKIVYALVGIILVAVVGALVNSVIAREKATSSITASDVQRLIEENNSKYFEQSK